MFHWMRYLTLAAVAALALPRAGLAEDALVTFAERPYATEATNHDLGRCGVCNSPRFESNQLVEVLGGRYTFKNVEQAYCPVCQVTTLNLERNRRTARFVRVLWWKMPASRGRVVRTSDAYRFAFASSDTTPFISTVTGLRKQNGTVYFVVE